MRPSPHDAESRRRFDRRVIQSALDGRHLPGFMPLEPSSLAAAEGAATVAPIVLDALAHAHGLARWTPDAFEEVFLREAMGAWHGDLSIEQRGRTLIARSATCPVLDAARRDARVCQMCRAFQVIAAKEAYGPRLHGVTFPRLVTRGDGACEMHLVASP